jgi:hypothetical protein
MKYGAGQFHYIEEDLRLVNEDKPEWPAFLVFGVREMYYLIGIRLQAEVILDDLDGFI